MHEFATAWQSYYVIVGAAAGALIGLQFVVITLIAENPPRDIANASAAFATPTIVHFSASLLLCAVMVVPWPTVIGPMVSWGALSVGGLVYTGVVASRICKQAAYRPGFEDWVFHLVLPAISYALLAFGALTAREHMTTTLFTVAASALSLLFIGIHNAWDAVSYHVFTRVSDLRRRADDSE